MLAASTASTSTGAFIAQHRQPVRTSWTAANNLALLHKPKGVASFSHRCSIGTNVDVAFASDDRNNRLRVA